MNSDFPHGEPVPAPRLVEARILDGPGIDHKIRRIALEILEGQPPGGEPLALVGIETRGVVVARRVHAILAAERPDVAFGRLDISLYRDDLDNLGTIPSLKASEIPFDVDGTRVVLFDDVLFTGRTVRAAIDGIMDFGRPARIELAVLVDRGNRELPIRADYVGEAVRTTRREYIRVRLKEIDGEDAVFLLSEGVPKP